MCCVCMCVHVLCVCAYVWVCVCERMRERERECVWQWVRACNRCHCALIYIESEWNVVWQLHIVLYSLLSSPLVHPSCCFCKASTPLNDIRLKIAIIIIIIVIIILLSSLILSLLLILLLLINVVTLRRTMLCSEPVHLHPWRGPCDGGEEDEGGTRKESRLPERGI